MGESAVIRFAPELELFRPARRRGQPDVVGCDGTATIGHVVESLGVPLPETGSLSVDGRPADRSRRLAGGEVVQVDAVRRPQPLAGAAFVLDVHLGTLARRMRLLGLDTAYANDRDDDALIEQANAERRFLLTQDRGLLRRRKLWRGGYVRGAVPEDQLRDVLGRFEPPLAPWTRCPACNGPVSAVRKAEVEHLLLAGTRRSYDDFSRCACCGKVYWRGAHAARLDAMLAAATAGPGSGAPGAP